MRGITQRVVEYPLGTVQVNGMAFTKIRFGFISVNPFGVDYAGASL